MCDFNAPWAKELDDLNFKKPKYLQLAARRKYGRKMFVLGATNASLRYFWNQVKYTSIDTQLPVEKGKTVVDIDCKTHVNRARPGTSTEKSADWYDDFEITSKKGKDESQTKAYQLQLTKSKEYQFGGNVKLGANVASFFTMGSGGPSITPEVGLQAGYKSVTTDTETTSDSRTEKLSQEYQVVDKLKVPPRTKVRANITTWAVTYEAQTTTKVTVDASAAIEIKYRTPLIRLLGGLFNQTGFLTARELFCGEDNFHIDEDNVLTFTRPGKVFYLGEEVEVNKKKTSVLDSESDESDRDSVSDD